MSVNDSSCAFIKSALFSKDFIPPLYPEIAFWGRSNVGKSSLLNALMETKNLARTSKTPGCTQYIQFYRVLFHFVFVDLPGYGYADAPLSVSNRWYEATLSYLQTRASLWKIYVLLDSRYPVKHIDHQVLKFLKRIQKPHACVLSKVDRLSPKMLQQSISSFQEQYPHTPLWPTSSKTLFGIKALREDIYHQTA